MHVGQSLCPRAVGNELVLLWSLADLGAFWEMRRLQGEDPGVEQWWRDVEADIASRSRRFMTREAFAAPPAGRVEAGA